MTNQESSILGTIDYLRALKRSHQEASEASSISLTSANDSLSSEAPGPERRAAPRYRCAGSAEFRAEGSEFRTWATVTDVSRSGCYVEIQATSPPDTPVDMVLDVIGVRVRVKGCVRVTYPFLGMGIAFTEVSAQDRIQLDEMLLRLSSSSSTLLSATQPQDPESTAAVSEIRAISDSQAALNAVVQFFQSNSSLGREEFLALVRNSQKDSSGV